jgi:serine/threonine protein kinase
MISADLGDVTIIGTCAYMSPEQVSGRKVDARSDIFAFGSTLYQMLSGRLPFRGDTATVVLAKILEAEPDPLEPDADVHYTALSRIARRCLHKRAELRYADAGSLLTDLETIRSEVVPLSPARVRFGTPARIAVVGVALIGAVLAYPRTGPTTPDTNLPGKTPPAAVTDSSAMPPPPIQLTGNAPEKSRHIPPERNPAAPKVPSTVAKVPGASNTNDTATPSDSTRRETNVGKLVLDSNPEASVSLDNRLIGITPLTLETSPGMHDLVMTSSDGLRWRGKVDVAAEGETRIERDLAAFGQLTITSDVWVEVSLDGGSPEQTPVRFARVPAGLHELRAYREGFVTQTLEIFIEEDKTRHIRVKLERKP